MTTPDNLTMEPIISVAPMVDITNVLFRNFMRLLTRKTTLWTEMITTNEILNTPHLDRCLWNDPKEHPVVVQLGGNDPALLAAASSLCELKGFDQINLNCGCPSNRVQDGKFGACLMLEPEKVRECCAEMKRRVQIPVTVKCRLGVDDHDSYENLENFISIVSSSGVNEFIVHARKALLSGLTPTQNRTIPKINYEYVYRLQERFPDFKFHINGEIATEKEGIGRHDSIRQQINRGLGVMIGRVAYNYPWLFRNMDNLYYGVPDQGLNRREIILQYAEYCDRFIEESGSEWNKMVMAKPLMNLFYLERGNTRYRNELDRLSRNKDTHFSIVAEQIVEIMETVNPEALNQFDIEETGRI